jgi:hypothetical protein
MSLWCTVRRNIVYCPNQIYFPRFAHKKGRWQGSEISDRENITTNSDLLMPISLTARITVFEIKVCSPARRCVSLQTQGYGQSFSSLPVLLTLNYTQSPAACKVLLELVTSSASIEWHSLYLSRRAISLHRNGC